MRNFTKQKNKKKRENDDFNLFLPVKDNLYFENIVIFFERYVGTFEQVLRSSSNNFHESKFFLTSRREFCNCKLIFLGNTHAKGREFFPKFSPENGENTCLWLEIKIAARKQWRP